MQFFDGFIRARTRREQNFQARFVDELHASGLIHQRREGFFVVVEVVHNQQATLIIFLEQVDTATIVTFGVGCVRLVAGKFQAQDGIAHGAFECYAESGRAVFNHVAGEFVGEFGFSDAADAEDKKRVSAVRQIVL